jgi:hypothetical protein
MSEVFLVVLLLLRSFMPSQDKPKPLFGNAAPEQEQSALHNPFAPQDEASLQPVAAKPDASPSLVPEPPFAPTALLSPEKPMPDLVPFSPESPVLEQQKPKPYSDYFSDPTTLSAVEKMYSSALPTFLEKGHGERMIAVGPDGKIAGPFVSDGGKSVSGSIPKGSQVLFHTHPLGGEQVPSQQDIDTAKQINSPNFVISRNAIYVATPDGSTKHPIKVADVEQGKGGHLKIKWAH